MATSDGFPTAAVVFFVFSYTTVFLLSVMGNVVVFCHCYSTIKRRQSLVKWFIANLAVSDLSFTGLSLLNFIAYLWTWLGGNATCKLQGFLIEACYTTSIATLAVISFERRKAVVTPFSARTNACDGVCKKLIVIWTSSLVINSPLLYAYETEIDASGSLLCTNSSFGDLGKQVYYSVHAFCVFIVPLVYMIYAQSSVFVTLRSRTFPTQDTFTTVSSDHHRKKGKKNDILDDLIRAPGKIRVLFVTVAFGIGVDCPHIREVVHIGVPRTSEEYFQESGRASRDGVPDISRILFNSYRTSSDKKNLHQIMRKFVTTATCRRRVILEYFGFTVEENCALHSCFDNCKSLCSCDDCKGKAVIHTTLNRLTIS
ncbi:substance-P receptor-like [Montipora capricornis]|uniref:substance-P receptor-like n=1 Tax=Montipora capricornis TaxID=246305 RepID=UPI0035F17454